MTFVRSSRILVSVLGALVVASIVMAQDVAYNAMPGANFAAFKTYKWVEIPGATQLDQITAAQITQALDAELATKGLTKTASDSADLHVGYQAAIKEQKQWNAYGSGMGYRYGGGMATATSSTIQIGTLVLDIYDQKGKQMVWTGNASKTIDPGAKPEKRQQNIAKAVKKMLKNYPPPTKK